MTLHIHLLEETRIELNVAVFALGCLIIIVGISRELLNAKVPASAISVATLVGIILGPHVLNLVGTNLDNSQILVQEISRLVIAIQLMAIALNIPFHYLQKAWLTQAVLLTLVVALMWITSGCIIYAIFLTEPFGSAYRFTFWEALLIGAAVAPTDPVLASAVSTSALAISQVPARLRHTITAESGLNDGTGYPFVMLCLRFVTRGSKSPGEVIGEWIIQDILWEILVAILIAVVAGFAVGKLLVFAEPAKLHDQQLLVALTVALAFAFVGGAQLLGINGLILVVVGGVVYAKVVEGDKRGTESQLQETVDLIFSTLVFAIFGLIIPFDRWYIIGWWRGLIICLGLAIFRRVPWILVLKPVFKEQIHSIPDALFVGWFGPIGVGAIFYALYAAEYLGHEDDRAWVVVSMIVFSQVIIFGVTDTFFTRLYARTNPNYIRRRKRKQIMIERAETQIMHIQEHVTQQLESMPASPQLEAGESPAWADIPELDIGHEFPGSPSSLDLRLARGETDAIDLTDPTRGVEMSEFETNRSERDMRTSHGVTFNLDTDTDYENENNNNNNNATLSEPHDNTILGTSRRLLGRALAQSHAGFGMRKNSSFDFESSPHPFKSQSDMRVSDLGEDAANRTPRRSSLPPPGSEKRKLSQSHYL